MAISPVAVVILQGITPPLIDDPNRPIDTSQMMPLFRNLLILFVVIVGNSRATIAQSTNEFDVVVFGATPAGVCASVAARRAGATVCLVEPLDLVGGMMSSGLSFSDSNQTARETLLGLFEEFHQRVENRYLAKGIHLPYRVAVKDQSPWTYEPHVAEAVFNELLEEAEIDVLLLHDLEAVNKEGVRITSLATTGGKEIRGRVFIDASYEGDLMAAAKVSYRIGREGPDVYGESLAGLRFPKPAMQVSPFTGKGELIPLITGRRQADDRSGDPKIMTYSYRLCLTDDPDNRIPFVKPDDYDPAMFELFRRVFAKHPDAHFPIDLYPIPGGKVDANNSIARHVSMGLVGASWEWPDATRERRRQIWQQHKRYTAGLLWFLINDPAVPERIRNKLAPFGLAKDEFARHDHWPPVLYIREARRMVGAYLLTQGDLLTKTTKPDSIAIGSFPIDSHDCQRLATDDGGFINEGTIYPKRIEGRKIGQPHQIPYRALTPKANECDNLLVPVCLSASHVAFSSVRVEPTWMVLGQSSGIAAALVARENVPVQKIEYEKLKVELADQNVVWEHGIIDE